MKNKETINGAAHNRPCFFAFLDQAYPAILWLVPVSSKYEKYKAIHDKKVERYGYCNTIRFGSFLGKEAAFLIQNICPVTSKYISEIYCDKNHQIVRIDERVVEDVIKNARAVYEKAKRGVNIVFPDIMKIYALLVNQLELDKQEEH